MMVRFETVTDPPDIVSETVNISALEPALENAAINLFLLET